MARKKTWKEKLHDSKDLPKVEPIPPKMQKTYGEGTIAIPSPIEVDEIMRKVPKGKLITINEIREKIARKHNATIGCPMTTGIFAWIAAHAAEEEIAAGKKRVTPYWRTLKSNGEINPKYPGGVQHQIELLEAEGHTVYPKGKKFYVEDFQKKLVK